MGELNKKYKAQVWRVIYIAPIRFEVKMVSLIASGRSKPGWRRWAWWWFRNTRARTRNYCIFS